MFSIEAMHIPTHILSGWCLGNCVRFSARERLFCMIAASAADIDGIGFFISEELYWRLHHYLGHNIFFGVALAAVLAAWSRRRLAGFGVYLGLFHLHLAMDYVGSGPGWMIHYLWPLSATGWRTHLVWDLFSWQNLLTAGVLLTWTILIACRHGRTPLELIAPRLDGQCTAWLVSVPKVAGHKNRTALRS
jgi:inner membrane protein